MITASPTVSPSPSAPWVFSPLEAAAVLGISRDAVYEALSRGELPGFRIGGVWKIPAADLARMCGIRDGEQIAGLRDELRRAQHEVREVVALADLEPAMATQLLEAIRRVGGVVTALTAQSGEGVQAEKNGRQKDEPISR